jgi:hypothetical protein
MANAYYLSHEVISDRILTPNEKLIYSVLRTDSTVVDKLSRKSMGQDSVRIANRIGCKSVRTVISALARLELLGAVKVINGGYLVYPYPVALPGDVCAPEPVPTEKEHPAQCTAPTNEEDVPAGNDAPENPMVVDLVLYMDDDEPVKKQDHPWRGIKSLRELFKVLTDKGTNRDECAKGRTVLFNVVPDAFLSAVACAIESADKMSHSLDSFKRYSMKELIDATKSVEDHDTYMVLADAYKTITKG